MTNINPNNWHYTVDSGSNKGSVVVPLCVLEGNKINCSVQFATRSTSSRGENVTVDAGNLTLVKREDFDKYHLTTPKAQPKYTAES